jgi:hypothetical protein
MKEDVIKYDRMTFYPLDGLDGYYGSIEGRILSVKRGYPILLKSADGQGYSYRAYIGKKGIILSPAKISFMVKERRSLKSLEGYLFTFIDGVPTAVDKQFLGKKSYEKRVTRITKNTKEKLAEIRRTIDMYISYTETGDLNPFYQEMEKWRTLFVHYAQRYSRKRLQKATEIAEYSMQEVLYNISKGSIILNLKEYVMEIIRRKVKMEKRDRKVLLGLRDNIENHCYYDF